ncbi:MAG: DMT family transporter [Actinomycetota bacterium]
MAGPTVAGRWSGNTFACVAMVLGSLGYVVNDALIRASTDEGLDVYQALFLRTAVMTVALGMITRRRGGLTRADLRVRALGLRVAAEVTSGALFFAAIVQIEFANAQTILMLVPFAVTAIAALRLGERVGPALWASVGIGFVGVLAVVQPATDGFSWWSLVVVASALSLVVRELATRAIPTSISFLGVATLTAAGLTILTGVISIFTGWGEIRGSAIVLLAIACGCLSIGYWGTIQTVRVGELSVSAPFRYTAVLGAVVAGMAFFDETPNALTLVGCTLIVTAGVAAVRIE